MKQVYLILAAMMLLCLAPVLNSINEKCARIRAAFVGQFDDYMAKSYYVDGQRGEAKKIWGNNYVTFSSFAYIILEKNRNFAVNMAKREK